MPKAGQQDAKREDSKLVDRQDAVSATVILVRKTDLAADWKDFSANVASSATDYFLKGWPDAAASGISSLVKLVSSVRLERNVGEKVWSLSVLGFAWGLNEVISAETDKSEFQTAFRFALDKAKQSVSSGGISVPHSFLTRPSTIDIYRSLRDNFVRQLLNLESNGVKNSLKYRLDAAFTRGVFELWSQRPEFYAPIAEVLKAPAALSAELELSWEAYRASLIYDYAVNPVFGQEINKISLGQLHVPLRASWLKSEAHAAKIEHVYFSPRNYNVSLVDKVLDDWLASDDSSDWLRLLGGGPGSGKSTTIRAFASRVATRAEWRPLYIPLQHIDSTAICEMQ
jgi:hypothetical protein